MRPSRGRVMATLMLCAALLISGFVGVTAPASASGGGTVDLSGAVPATFTVTPGVEQLTITGAPARSPLTLADAATLERIITLYTDDLGQLVIQYVGNDYLVFDPQTQGVLPTVDGHAL